MIYNTKGITCWDILHNKQVGWIHLDFEKVFVDYDVYNFYFKSLDYHFKKSLSKGWLNFR
jgi:hypothetical protein